MFSFEYYYDKNHVFHGAEENQKVKKCDPDEIVLLPNKEYTLIIDYSVRYQYKSKIKTGKRGITRLKLADKICKHYDKMYRENDRSGKYGIYGHDINDLILVSATVDEKNNIRLGVDS